MRSENVTFENEQGERLAGRLDLPVDGEPAAYALFAHCFTCTKNHEAAGHISRALVQQGVAVLRFDVTGLGESEGDFSETSFSSNVGDLVAAARFLERERRPPGLLVGHSLGGAAVLQAAEHLPDVQAVATIAAPYDPEHITNLFEADALGEIRREGEAVVNLGGRPFTIKQQFLDDLKAGGAEETIHNLGRPLLVFHSPVDQTVGIENAALVFQAAKHPKSFISLDHADHLLSDEADARYVGAMLAAWARTYLPAREERMERPDTNDNVVVARNEAGFRTDILANGFALVADEPASVGGTATGPTPYDYLVAGLGACTVMTLRMYADRKGWPLGTATVRLRHEKIHATDCAACEAEEGKIDRIERELEITGDLDGEQRQRLLEIADRCPVHRTLESEIHVETWLVEEGRGVEE